MAEDQGKIDDGQSGFTREGEAIRYIDLDQAQILAMQIATENPGDYGDAHAGIPMAFEVARHRETEDHYMITLTVRPQGDFAGRPGREQFFIEKEGSVAHRQVLALPKPGRPFPVIPVAIGLGVAGVVAVIAVLAVGGLGRGDDSQPGAAASLPTATPTRATQTPLPAPTEAPAVVPPNEDTPSSTPNGTNGPALAPTPTPPAVPPPTQDLRALVQEAVQDAVPAAPEGVTADDVQSAISAALAQAAASGISEADIQAAVSKAVADAAAAGATEADVRTAVTNAIAAASSDALTADQVQRLITEALAAAIPAEDVKKVVKFHDASWATLWLHNNIAMYIVENGYGYPVENVQGTTGTMKVALPLGDLHVNMELWRMNAPAWYQEFVVEKGQVVDLAGTGDILPRGAKGQVIATGGQGFYVPTYVIKGDPDRGIEPSAPDLKSVFDLPQYTSVFQDLEDPDKGLLINCLVDWQCHKINRAKWAAYGLNDTYNVLEPGSGAALDAAIQGAYDAGEPILSYYWEPTALLNRLDMTRLDEPPWTQACDDVLAAAVAQPPYVSAVGCGYPFGDIHVGVHKSLVERAPEVAEFLANMFIGTGILADVEAWKIQNDKKWRDAAVFYLRGHEDAWTGWVPASVAHKVKLALAQEPLQ